MATAFYDEIEIEDMTYVESEQMFYYPCPCGDKFRISMDAIFAGEEVASCPSCSLQIKVIYNPEDFVEVPVEDEEIPLVVV